MNEFDDLAFFERKVFIKYRFWRSVNYKT